MNSIRSDASQLRNIGAQLRKSQPAMLRAVRRAVRTEGAKQVVEAAKQSSDWSTRIPGSIKVTNYGLVGVKIRAGGTQAPHAPAYENKGKPGNFRHPLNYPNQGNRQNWVSQTARPFLLPSLAAHWDAIRKSLVDAASGAVEASIKAR